MDNRQDSNGHVDDPPAELDEQRQKVERLQIWERFKNTPPAHDARWWDAFRKEMRANPIIIDGEE